MQFIYDHSVLSALLQLVSNLIYGRFLCTASDAGSQDSPIAQNFHQHNAVEAIIFITHDLRLPPEYTSLDLALYYRTTYILAIALPS